MNRSTGELETEAWNLREREHLKYSRSLTFRQRLQWLENTSQFLKTFRSSGSMLPQHIHHTTALAVEDKRKLDDKYFCPAPKSRSAR